MDLCQHALNLQHGRNEIDEWNSSEDAELRIGTQGQIQQGRKLLRSFKILKKELKNTFKDI